MDMARSHNDPALHPVRREWREADAETDPARRRQRGALPTAPGASRARAQHVAGSVPTPSYDQWHDRLRCPVEALHVLAVNPQPAVMLAHVREARAKWGGLPHAATMAGLRPAVNATRYWVVSQFEF